MFRVVVIALMCLVLTGCSIKLLEKPEYKTELNLEGETANITHTF